MSTLVGSHLPPALLDRLSARQAAAYADRAVIVVTVDGDGAPHPSMVSALELVALDAQRLRLALPAFSRTARHLTANGHLTIIVAEAEAVHYIKAHGVPQRRGLTTLVGGALFEATVGSVLEDAAAGHEHARIVSGITLDRAPTDAATLRARLEDLLGRPWGP